MKVCKKILAGFCSIIMVISLLTAPVSAEVDIGAVIEGLGYVATFGSFALDIYDRWKAAHPDASDSEYPGFNPGGSYGGGASRGEIAAKKAYNDYVSTLPTTGYNSVGHLIWQPTLDDVYRIYYVGFLEDEIERTYTLSQFTSSSFVEALEDSSGFAFHVENPSAVLSHGFGLTFAFEFPISGQYRRLVSTRARGYVMYTSDSYATLYVDYTGSLSFDYYAANSRLKFSMTRIFESEFVGKSFMSYRFNWYLPFF